VHGARLDGRDVFLGRAGKEAGDEDSRPPRFRRRTVAGQCAVGNYDTVQAEATDAF
jgi:hypothetical protein